MITKTTKFDNQDFSIMEHATKVAFEAVSTVSMDKEDKNKAEYDALTNLINQLTWARQELGQ